MVTAIEVFHLDGMILVDNHTRIVFWACASGARAFDVACSRKRGIESNVLIHTLAVKKVVFRIERLSDFDSAVCIGALGELAVSAKLNELVLLGAHEKHVAAHIAEVHDYPVVVRFVL